jgi:hypothetical protein
MDFISYRAYSEKNVQNLKKMYRVDKELTVVSDSSPI